MGLSTNWPEASAPEAKNRQTEPVRVMIVDDSLVVRTVMTRVIGAEPDIAIVGKIGSAEMALAQLERTPADVVLLDLEMPGMGGMEAVPKILAAHDGTQVLVVSSLTDAGAEHTLAALAMGAADTMLKPRPGEFDENYRKALLAKIRALGSRMSTIASPHPGKTGTRSRLREIQPPSIIAIGASTGGIHALGILLRNLPRSVRAPIVITQHLPASFSEVFARQIQSASDRETFVAEDGMAIEPGCIYVANGDGHMVVRSKGSQLVLGTVHGSTPSGCTPSVDPLFRSLSEATGPRSLGIVLSGMGRDGCEGAEELVEAGGSILVQDRESSAVWGMPRAIAEAGLAAAVLPPKELAMRVANHGRVQA